MLILTTECWLPYVNWRLISQRVYCDHLSAIVESLVEVTLLSKLDAAMLAFAVPISLSVTMSDWWLVFISCFKEDYQLS